MKRLPARSVLCVAFLSLVSPGLPLSAQEPPKKDEKKTAEEEKKPKVTEEMTVTARKKVETIQEVPISVAAPTESELRDRGAETIEDVAANVAGFTVQNLGPGQSQVAMRGVSSGQVVRDQPGVKEQVGVYLDESVISLSLFTPDIDLFDLSRVEVLRGPQGTLFGSGSESGTVRYITNQPKIGVTESVGELSAGMITSHGSGGSFKFATNVPLGDTAAARFVGYYTRYGGYIDAVQPTTLLVNRDVNSGSRGGGRLTFFFKPNDNLSITPRFIYQNVDMNGWNRIDAYNIMGNPYTTTRPKIVLGDRRQVTQMQEPFKDNFTLGDVNISYGLGGATLTSITSWTNRTVDVLRDATALTASVTGGSFALPAGIYTLNAPLDDATRARAVTEEVRLSGSVQRLQWVGGAFYANTRRNYAQHLLVTGYEDECKVINCHGFGGGTPGTFIAPQDGLFWSDLRYKYRQYALFGEATYSVTNRLDVTGGLRYYNFNEHRVQTFDGTFANPGTNVGSVSANGIAPRVIASFKVSDATRLNAQVSKGFRLGGINDPLNVPLCTAQDLITFGGNGNWKDETLWNYEVGGKSTIMGNRGALNAAVFYADIRDLQATVTAGSCSSRVVFNVPRARSAGAEVEFELAPSDAFDFAISASHTDSKLRSTVTSTDKNGVVSVVAGIQSGNRLPTVPRDQAAAAGTFHWQMSGGKAGYATGVFQHIGDRFTQIGDQAAGFGTVSLVAFAPGNIGGPYTQNTFTFNPKLPAYNIINLRAGILKGRWDTALYVNNATDKKALLALDQERGTLARVGFLTNQPRTIGISTRVNF
jgi:iron complex outermembrane recepter protein